ncbi:MAG: cache domain-containing protein [Methanocalculaceae archaeon]|jgi:hypothetical protein|nr:cache domain-containing protein [Methanocalculaceae archaeon]
MNHRSSCVIAVLILLGLAVLCAGCIDQDQQQPSPSLEETYADQMRATENLTLQISDKLANLQEALIQAADTIANDMENTTLVDQEFNKLYLTYQEVEVFMIADEHKIVRDVCPEDNSYLGPYLNTRITNPYFNITADSPRLNFGHFQYENRAVAAVVIPLITSDKEYKGALITVVDSSLFYQDMIYAFQKNTGYHAWIVDEEGRILYYPERAQYTTDIMQLKSPNQTELNQVLQAILEKKSGVATYSEYNYAKLKITRQAATWDTMPGYMDSNYVPIVVVTSEINSSQQITHPEESANQNLEEFINAAYLFAKENGREAALAEFNNPNGKFTTAEYYIAAFAMNGTLLSNPYRTEIVGENRLNSEDVNGVHTLRMFADRALQGGGYVTNVYENPADDMQTEVKISYVLPVNDEWYITAGEFHPEIDAVVPPTVRIDMIQYARSVEVLIQENGRDAAAASLNNKSHYRADIELNIFDKYGNLIVHDSNPEMVGTNLMGATDIYGASIIREVIMFAGNGGGFRYTNMPLETRETTELSLVYVKQIGDDRVLLISVPMNKEE